MRASGWHSSLIEFREYSRMHSRRGALETRVNADTILNQFALLDNRRADCTPLEMASAGSARRNLLNLLLRLTILYSCLANALTSEPEDTCVCALCYARRLLRFLRGRGWNMKDAEKQLRSAIEWRRERRPSLLDCRWCHERAGYHALVCPPFLYSFSAVHASVRH